MVSKENPWNILGTLGTFAGIRLLTLVYFSLGFKGKPMVTYGGHLWRPPVELFFYPIFWKGEGEAPTKIDRKKVGTLILTSEIWRT